jgi:xanthine dehydrogenase iron-sulfur cluster and FAD-binding subunit A
LAAGTAKGTLVHFLQPTTWTEALAAMAALPRGLPVAGGTDAMVELNFHRCRPEALIDLGRIHGLGEVSRHDGWLRVGAAATYDQLDQVQEAFAEAGAIQCGSCTPGLVMAVHDLLRRVSDPADDQIREALAGNLCRCTGYQKIISAVHVAARNTNGRHGLSHEEVEERSHAIPE